MNKLKTEWLFSKDADDIFNISANYECENKDDPEDSCDHDYSRCQIITGIYSNGFTIEGIKGLIDYYILPKGVEIDEKTQNKIIEIFQQYDLEDTSLFNYQTDRGYYGEYIDSCYLTIASEIAEKLNQISLD